MAQTKASPKSGDWPGAFEAFNSVKEKIKDNIWTIVLAFIMYYAASLVVALVVGFIFNRLVFFDTIVTYLISLSLSSIFVGALTALYLDILKAKLANIEDYVRVGWENFSNMFVTLLLMVITFFVSFALFIVPFFFIFPRLNMAPYLVIKKKLKATEALSESWRMTAPHYGKIYGVIGVTILCLIPSFIGVGLSALTGIFVLQSLFSLSGFVITFYFLAINIGAQYKLANYILDHDSK